MGEAAPDVGAVGEYLRGLQRRLCEGFEQLDGGRFVTDRWQRSEGGGGDTRVLSNGRVFEQAGVNFSQVQGDALPESASVARPELKGCGFHALGVSVVAHPVNPYVPAAHLNVRFFLAEKAGEGPVWWFGGGFDLTPCYPFDKDVRHWHRTASDLCEPFGAQTYARFKRWCDEYFYLKHRNETRGVGGLFFDDLNEWGFETCFDFMRAVGDSFLTAYRPIVERHRDHHYGERERDFLCYRRGRYAEFNLVYDRGTLFGLQSGGRTESILMSLPPKVIWRYNWQPAAGSVEAKLAKYLKPRDWLRESEG